MKGKVGTKTSLKLLWHNKILYNPHFMKAIRSILNSSLSEVVQFRLMVLDFYKENGLKLTMRAYKVSRATIFRWKKALKDGEGRLESLIPASTATKNKRKMLVAPEIIAFIKELREKHPRLGKEKIKPLLDEFCKAT